MPWEWPKKSQKKKTKKKKKKELAWRTGLSWTHCASCHGVIDAGHLIAQETPFITSYTRTRHKAKITDPLGQAVKGQRVGCLCPLAPGAQHWTVHSGSQGSEGTAQGTRGSAQH